MEKGAVDGVGGEVKRMA